jgi:hypothetical protein
VKSFGGGAPWPRDWRTPIAAMQSVTPTRQPAVTAMIAIARHVRFVERFPDVR